MPVVIEEGVVERDSERELASAIYKLVPLKPHERDYGDARLWHPLQPRRANLSCSIMGSNLGGHTSKASFALMRVTTKPM